MNKATANVVRAIEELYSIDVASRVLIGNKRNFFLPFAPTVWKRTILTTFNVLLSNMACATSQRVTRSSRYSLNKTKAP